MAMGITKTLEQKVEKRPVLATLKKNKTKNKAACETRFFLAVSYPEVRLNFPEGCRMAERHPISRCQGVKEQFAYGVLWLVRENVSYRIKSSFWPLAAY
jgi:hypothetical protein